jgi:iron complex transport system substrate-binding protein
MPPPGGGWVEARIRERSLDLRLAGRWHYSHRMRIVSLVPHATELLFALDLGDQVVAVTHECDHPPEALQLPRVTRDVLPPGLSAGEIDAAVRSRTEQGQAIYELDEDALIALQPDLIVTQALCPVCAVSYTEVAELAKRIPSHPQVLSLDPKTFGETLGDVRTVAQAIGSRERGVELIADAAARIDRVKLAVRSTVRPRVVALEWLDPVFVAGHWTPQLIELAGGEDLLGLPGEHSITVSWDAVIAAAPEIVVVMPCGYDAPRAHLEALEHADALAEIGARQVVAVNASAYFSRPGPRLIDGLELLAHIFHPELVPHAPAGALTVDLSGTANPTNDDGDIGGDEQDPGGEQNAGTVRTGAPH